MKLHDYFDGLLINVVNINDDRLRQLDEHVEAIKSFLRDDEDLSRIIRSFIRQGSWAQRTIIRPLPGHEFDADLLVDIKRQGGWSDDPKQYLLSVHRALMGSARYNSRVELKTRCVRVVYAQDCHVDLVPYVRSLGLGMWEQHQIVNRARNRFEDVNPDGFTNWMRERDRWAKGNLRKTIRLLKYLRDYKGTFQVPSVILTVLVGDRVSWWSGFLGQYDDLPTAFTRLVSATDTWLQAHPDKPAITDPSFPSARFDHRLTPQAYGNFRSQFHGYTEKIQAAYGSETQTDSIIQWRDIFGPRFAPAQ
jgi:hypothetical protein